MEGALLEVDLDGYQTTLEEVLTWLLSAEDALQVQEEVSDDVEEVKDQFHTHEVWEYPQLGSGFAWRENKMLAHVNRGDTFLSSGWWFL